MHGPFKLMGHEPCSLFVEEVAAKVWMNRVRVRVRVTLTLTRLLENGRDFCCTLYICAIPTPTYWVHTGFIILTVMIHDDNVGGDA